MATTTGLPDLRTQAGARWLAGFFAVVLVGVLIAVLMLVYPHAG